MNFSMKRMNAILIKDLKELSKNMYISITLLLPIAMAALMGGGDGATIETHFFAINLAFTCVAAFAQSAFIAEEKEKNTLRGLMLSPASTFEILGGKSLLSFITTIVTIIICAFITGYEPTNILIVSIAIAISTIFYIAIGTLLGLLTKSVMEASVAILPVMFLFSFGSLIMMFVADYPTIVSIIEYLPSVQLEILALAVENGAGFADVWKELLVIAAWSIVGILIATIVYKKRRMDD